MTGFDSELEGRQADGQAGDLKKASKNKRRTRICFSSLVATGHLEYSIDFKTGLI